mmetsp:Transcript_45855/g.67682  ORF Transcript_45855/g.67682 Transcript_45855/m.67682 type:complete len:140 (+) Transcript_45855:3-422(+)
MFTSVLKENSALDTSSRITKPNSDFNGLRGQHALKQKNVSVSSLEGKPSRKNKSSRRGSTSNRSTSKRRGSGSSNSTSNRLGSSKNRRGSSGTPGTVSSEGSSFSFEGSYTCDMRSYQPNPRVYRHSSFFVDTNTQASS